MSVTIRNNTVSQAAAGQLNSNQSAISRSAERLSSGSRTARAGDDAAGSAVAFNLSTKARSTRQAMRNANDGISVLTVADQANNTLTERLQRMRELTVQSANGVLSDDERKYIQQEFQRNINDIKNVGSRTNFNGIKVIEGGSLEIQVGANQNDNNQISIGLPAHNQIYINIRSSSVSTQDGAKSAMVVLDKEMDRLNDFQASVGSDMNRLTAAIRFSTEQEGALISAASRIEDTDYALETADMTAHQVKSQASTAAVAQANGLARGVIGLIA